MMNIKENKMRICGLSIVLWAATAIGCSENTPTSEQLKRLSPLNLSVHIGGSADSPQTQAQSVKSRGAVVENAFKVGTKIGVGIVKDPTETSASYYNQSSHYTLTKGSSNDSWIVNSGLNGLFVSTQKAYIIGYYPVGKTPIVTMDEHNSYITPTVLQTMDMGDLGEYSIGGGIGVQFGDEVVKISTQEVDYMVGRGASIITAAQPSSTLTLAHSMAMVSVRSIKADNYLGEGILTSFTIANSPTGTKPLCYGTVKLWDNSFSKGSAEVSYTRTFTGYNVEESADYNDRVGFFAFPATIAANDLAISVVVDGKSYSVATNPKALTFEAGKLTRLNITVSATEVKLDSNISVEDWTDTTDQGFEVE